MNSVDRPVFFIVNPAAASGSLGRRWSRVRSQIEAAFGSIRFQFTTRAGDARNIARTAMHDGYSLIVAVGGDGTINEIADGILISGKARDVQLGIIPYGTGGDFRRSTNISRRITEAVRQLTSGDSRTIDVGRVTYRSASGSETQRHFINIAGFGMSGLVDHIVSNEGKWLGGKMGFAWATLRALKQYQAPSIRLTLDDKAPISLSPQLVAVANGRFFGGGMCIAPEAQLDDQIFDVIIVDRMGTWEFLRKAPRVYKGTHLSLPGVHSVRARRVVAEPVEGSALLDVDGEQMGQLPATFEIVPRALSLRGCR